MLLFVVFACATFCLMGLFQWARGGAGIWEIFDFLKKADDPEDGLEKESVRGRRTDREKRVKRSLDEIQSRTDRLLKSSLKTLGVLAGIMWFFIAVVIVSEMFGVDILDQMGFRAARYWSKSGGRVNSSGRSAQNNSVRQIGSGIRK